MDSLIERLRATYAEALPTGKVYHVLYNRDGPKAADALEAQQAEIARLREVADAAENVLKTDAGAAQLAVLRRRIAALNNGEAG